MEESPVYVPMHPFEERLIAAIREASTAPLEMGFFINYCPEDILKQAKESSLRYERGDVISVLDGVPIAIKDEIDCAPYPTTGGTKWLHKMRESKGDAECVLKLRQCGAILIGKTNMHELGAGTSGINPHYGATKNPYDIKKITGGSSSGSAAVVAAGLCPVALGVDGGGSVRMPAALCGIIGFKPTFGRISHSGVLPLNWTVGMVGVLAGTVEDALIVYSAISGEMETLEEHTNEFPIKTVEVIIPEIETMRLAHYITIGSECSTALASHLTNSKNLRKSGWDVRVGLSIYGAFSSKEYIQAQRVRNRQFQIHKNVFALADVIVTPTTGVTAYPILNDCLKTGELDYVNGAALVRYQIAGNFLGLPAITVPDTPKCSHMRTPLRAVGFNLKDRKAYINWTQGWDMIRKECQSGCNSLGSPGLNQHFSILHLQCRAYATKNTENRLFFMICFKNKTN
ncbi:Fatty acid amide hydrolase [Linum perenne]